MTFPVMLATKMCPRASTLTESTIPVANIKSSRLTTVNRSETGDTTGMA
jgi:hypothetical protein